MLEVKDLYRCYKPKKGAEVVALNKVSLKFPDKGLIFILGKSGSGKSTLLNVMGGLDKCDSGEIIIKGKSSVDFKQSDFDSYRNTYLGFIFQEYNILDEFNVGQNIALALELQGKKATSDEINRILDEVDLVGYGSRKTNELSGGQKQRVAIARALVKNPEIIFADEPTGALDSKTGMAVFDTLKKLSESKLVIVVSHDREFAELYGDRVIELADGNIISDIEKTKISGNAVSKGITIVDDKVIKIDKDYQLTSQDMELIRTYLNKTAGERLISLDDRINENVRHNARIDELGNQESFKNTDQNSIVNNPGEFNSIRSRLSLRHCFRIGGSSLKVKPFRLIITIILSIVAFGMFGLADTMASYDKVDATVNTIKDENVKYIAFEKNIIREYDGWTSEEKSNSGDTEKKAIEDKYGVKLDAVYTTSTDGREMYINNFYSSTSDPYRYYPTSAQGFISATEKSIKDLGFEIVEGKFPTKENEILIPKHLYESFKAFGYRDGKSNSYMEASKVTTTALIGKTISMNSSSGYTLYTITGIVDTKLDATRYEPLKDAMTQTSNIGLYMLSNQFAAEMKYGYHDVLFTTSKTIEGLLASKSINLNGYLDVKYGSQSFNSSSLTNYKEGDASVLLKSGKNSLGKGETVLDINSIYRYYQNEGIDTTIPKTTVAYEKYTTEVDTLTSLMSQMDSSNWTESFAAKYYDEAISNGMDIEEIYEMLYGQKFSSSNGSSIDRDLGISIFAESLRTYASEVQSYLSISFEEYYLEKIDLYLSPYLDEIVSNLPNLKVSYTSYSFYDSKAIELSLKVVGIQLSISDKYSYETPLCISEADIEKFGVNTSDNYSYFICQTPENKDLLKNIISDGYNQTGVENISVEFNVMPAFDMVNDMIETMAQVFLWVGVGFAVFAALMLFNFISISISYKKREIGILRAVGARSKDVFNIFFSESFIIAMISYVFAIVVTFGASILINTTLKEEAGLVITLLSPGIRQFSLVLVVCLAVALVSTFIPVYKIAMKRPIDAIRDR